MSCLTSLPDEVLKLVMKHVPLDDRLTKCCLVNSRLHAAAVAATQDLQLSFGNGLIHKQTRHPECWFQWALQYGEHLTCLRLSEFPQALQQLPCPNLLELSLNYTPSVQLGPAADGTPGVIQGCTKLTKLELQGSRDVSAQGDVVDSLSSLIHLQHLEFRIKNASALSIATLPRMQHLTYLDASSLSVENLLQLGALTSLQEFGLVGTRNTVAIGPSSVPGLVLPASLTNFVLLAPVEIGILSVVPTTLQDLWLECEFSGPIEGPGSLLSGLARLQHLTQLHVYSERGAHEWPLAGAAYTALTVSSSLHALMLHGVELPESVWQHVFPATHKLPRLTYLSVNDGNMFGSDAPASAWGAADVRNLVSCCPNLCIIQQITLQPGLHVSELHKLMDLTYLDVFSYTDDLADFLQSLKGLAAITQLRWLNVALDTSDILSDVSAASLLPLTSLTALTNFKGGMLIPDGSRLVLEYRSTQVNTQTRL